MAAVDSALGGLKLFHGTSKTPRKIDVHWGQDEPPTGEGDVPVWIRDEWSVTESAVKKAAAEAGDEPYRLRLPAQARSRPDQGHPRQLRRLPTTPSGARLPRLMKARPPRSHEDPQGHRRRAAQLPVPGSRVPGACSRRAREVTTSNLREAVDTAAGRSLIRLFPKFSAGDNPNWGKVVTKARDGAPRRARRRRAPRRTHDERCVQGGPGGGDPAGTKGADLQKRFAGPPCGWPKGAISGAVLTLLAAGNIELRSTARISAAPRSCSSPRSAR